MEKIIDNPKEIGLNNGIGMEKTTKKHQRS
jgi:hypothetical protein